MAEVKNLSEMFGNFHREIAQLIDAVRDAALVRELFTYNAAYEAGKRAGKEETIQRIKDSMYNTRNATALDIKICLESISNDDSDE